uniref:glutamate carboxypeptidase II n=1 Tax=Ciona savignyi TaxID=51511 RepID=H2ZD94_CIOSA
VKRKPFTPLYRCLLILCSVVAAGLSIGIGVLIGKNVRYNQELPNYQLDYNDKIRQMVFDEIQTTNIKKNLHELTVKPYEAGSHQEEVVLVDSIENTWKSYLDKVEIYPYDVLLSYPNITDQNYVGLLHPNGSVTMKTNFTEKLLVKNEDQPGVIPSFLAYTPSGDVSGDLFYVNYASVEDFEELLKLKVNVTGAICMARYGYIFRGDKIKNAEKFNCVGLVLFSDPYDYGGNGYPNSWWSPPSGFQRGSTQLHGDPLTPDYPALDLTHRIQESETNLGKIQAQPISYEQAYEYISKLGDTVAPEAWHGGMNVTYRLGGSFEHPHENCKAEIHIGNVNVLKKVHNVIGYIKGWQDPDKYVIIGNHRDAWTYGGLDPSSGTAVVLEVARAIAALVRDGKWRPRRTLVFCNWGAEEHGLIGSTEWTEQLEKRLLLRAIAYINIDIAVQGSATLRASATPTLYSAIYNTTKVVPNPNIDEISQNRSTVFDTWLYKKARKVNLPPIGNLGSGSDYTTFLQKCGVASVDLIYSFDKRIPSYPSYHSLHDTFDYMEYFVDPKFKYSKAIAEVAADLMMKLSSLPVLPLSPNDYSAKLKSMFQQFNETNGEFLNANGIHLTNLESTIDQFNEAAAALSNAAEKLNVESSDAEIRVINDRLFEIDRGFLDFKGLPGQQWRHVIFAPASHNSYSASGFPGVTDAIYNLQHSTGTLDEVRQQLSVLALKILSAADLMK